jgi:ribosomal protein S18 acetylase RimI-like enzyme
VFEPHGGGAYICPVQVRLASARDAKGIAGIQERGWQAAYRHVFPPADLDRGGFVRLSRWRERLRRPPAGWATFVAIRDRVIVGFVSIGPSRDIDGAGEVYAIYVDPAAWSTGAGRGLMERAERELAATYDEATLWVLEDNPRARRFYELAGWATDGERKVEERWGVRAPEVRYRKRFNSSRS